MNDAQPRRHRIVRIRRGLCSRCGQTYQGARGSRIIEHHPELQRQLVSSMSEDYEMAYCMHEPDTVVPCCDSCHGWFHRHKTEPLFERYWGPYGLRDSHQERDGVSMAQTAALLLGSACSAAWWMELDRYSYAKMNGRLRWNPLPEGRDDLNVPPPDDWSYTTAKDRALRKEYDSAIAKLDEMLAARNSHFEWEKRALRAAGLANSWSNSASSGA